jgi:hypothetical protein
VDAFARQRQGPLALRPERALRGQLHWVRNLAVDSRGNIYTAEVDNGTRVQKFADKGLFPITD